MRPSKPPPRVVLALAALLAAAPAALGAAPGSSLRVLQHHALDTLRTDAAGRPTSFEVYGRRFELDLERNDRLRFVTPRTMPDVEAWRGTLRGLPRSWVRLTRTPAGLYGMFSDGSEVYAIEPARELAGSAVGPLAARGSAPVVYRLADTLLPADGASCGTATLDAAPGSTALEQLEAVGAELRAALATGSLAASRQMEIGVVADFEFSQLSLGGLTPEQAIATRMNVVDGIYASQAGVTLIVSSATVYRSAADPFSSTLDANALLDEVGEWRRATPSQASAGLTHLMTGRDLEGTTVGIAYIATLCSPRFGVGLSQALGLSATSAALVVAHEIGHNFGARHDGESGSVCESTPQTFLMAPRLNNSDQFSQCSLDTIAPRIAAASCIVPREIADAELDVPAPAARARDAVFDYGFAVRSVGERQVEGITVSVALPAALAFEGGSVQGGAACAAAASTVSCSVGALAPGASRGVTLSLRGRQTGSAVATFTLDASNDAVAGNDSRTATFVIEPSADLSVSLSASPARFNAGGTSQVTATVRHLGGDPVGDARLTLTVPASLTVTAVGANALGCTLSAGAVLCGPVPLAPSAVETVTFAVTGNEPGSRQVVAGVASAVGDPAAGNDSAQVQLTVDAPSSAGGSGAGTGSGGGGGGALGALSALALLGLARRRLAARREVMGPLGFEPRTKGL